MSHETFDLAGRQRRWIERLTLARRMFARGTSAAALTALVVMAGGAWNVTRAQDQLRDSRRVVKIPPATSGLVAGERSRTTVTDRRALPAQGTPNPGHASPAPGTLLWQDLFNQAEGFDEPSAVAAGAGVIAVVGESTNAAGAFQLIVRAYDGETGVLLWQDTNTEGIFDEGAAIAIRDGIVVVGGGSDGVDGTTAGLVRAYALRTGHVLWDDVFSSPGSATSIQALAIEGNTVFAAGLGGANCSFFEISDCNWVVRSYDLKRGRLRWAIELDGEVHADDQAFAVAVLEDRVFVSGAISLDLEFTQVAFSVAALDARSGRELWRDVSTDGGGGAIRVATDRGRVFVVGLDGNNWLVRRYDPRHGGVIWEDVYSRTGTLSEVFDVAWQLDVQGNSLLVSGYGSQDGPNFVSRDWVVRAYDARNGELRWMDELDFAGGFDEAIGGAAIRNGQALTYGVVSTADTGPLMYVRSSDLDDGALLWESLEAEFDNSSPFGARISMVVDDSRLTVVGRSFFGSGPFGFGATGIVRTYHVARERGRGRR
jgi:hypothetical protein